MKKYFCLFSLIFGNAFSNLVYFPESIPGTLHYSVGLNVSKLPTQVVEEELNQSAMVNFSAKYDLPKKFSLHFDFKTIYITNDVSLGLSWNYPFKTFSVGILNKLAYWYGQAKFDNFDSSAYGFVNYPSIYLGHKYKNLHTTIGGGLDFLIATYKYSGDIETKNSKNKMTGYNLFLITEQPLWKDNFVTVGFKLHRSSYYYQSWIAFSTLEYKLWVPEIILGYNL